MISGITSGTSGCILKSPPLSITMAPFSTAFQPKIRLAPFSPSVPAKKTKSIPSKLDSSVDFTRKGLPEIISCLSLVAKISIFARGKFLSKRTSTIFLPTRPAPITATLNFFLFISYRNCTELLFSLWRLQ